MLIATQNLTSTNIVCLRHNPFRSAVAFGGPKKIHGFVFLCNSAQAGEREERTERSLLAIKMIGTNRSGQGEKSVLVCDAGSELGPGGREKGNGRRQ